MDDDAPKLPRRDALEIDTAALPRRDALEIDTADPRIEAEALKIEAAAQEQLSKTWRQNLVMGAGFAFLALAGIDITVYDFPASERYCAILGVVLLILSLNPELLPSVISAFRRSEENK